VEQTVVALYQANESAFTDGNMNRLPAGAVLALPPAGTAAAIELSEARRIILLHQAAHRHLLGGRSRRAKARSRALARQPLQPAAAISFVHALGRLSNDRSPDSAR
jgi:pilus assembly protein FimV